MRIYGKLNPQFLFLAISHYQSLQPQCEVRAHDVQSPLFYVHGLKKTENKDPLKASARVGRAVFYVTFENSF